MTFQNRKILIGITGSIAAYKIPLLVRLLIKEGAEVKVLMTPAACDFVTPLTLSTLINHPVCIEPFDKATGAWNSHVDLANWADLFLLAPLTANTLAKMATGVTDNLLMATYLAARCPVFFAPAMDLDMYKHPTTQRNIEIVRSFGHTLIEPGSGELASGLYGEGRMEEPEHIAEILSSFFYKSKSFAGKNVLVTAGPTLEAIDPVRFISNHSSGKMGFALAGELSARGANVTLVSGPVSLATPSKNIHRIDVVSASQMLEACKNIAPSANLIIMAAAVADFTPKEIHKTKIKKKQTPSLLELIPTIDILATLGKQKQPHQTIVGFALETDNVLENARMKLQNKNADIIVLNSLSDEGAGFGGSNNKITILDTKGRDTAYELKPKTEVAADIADYIFDFMSRQSA
ncbi:MAG: bifunctional phosphopantothenoylcysteine decarboxylase/phosphopantothenate--cysteine ligase CoaBC [Bacteroidales bacterium]|nr:bifunctional phosphopantothenoylcysteine decarboxylase/phosphopantothenate--cysteine ligase CoaBC [Bacteroidales bacterium]MDZ4203929.1 bifunctional phosphopantothenoylcysteine decarboxylase/phosphopantothenate--cysteine ligase CoaBC [Bacteroidales bacterium]